MIKKYWSLIDDLYANEICVDEDGKILYAENSWEIFNGKTLGELADFINPLPNHYLVRMYR